MDGADIGDQVSDGAADAFEHLAVGLALEELLSLQDRVVDEGPGARARLGEERGDLVVRFGRCDRWLVGGLGQG